MGLLNEPFFLDELGSNAYDMALDSQEAKEVKRLEWLMQKRGVFSASEAYRLVTVADRDELPKGAITYVEEKVDEEMTLGIKEGYRSKDMDAGSLTEPESMEEFMERTGFVVDLYGEDQEFIKLGKNLGATPDGMIRGINAGVEGKCPISKTHIFYLRFVNNPDDLKKHRPAYYWQCQIGMLVTGCDSWYWFSYCKTMKNPSLRMKFMKVERNQEDIDFFKARHQKAVALKNSIIRELNG